MSGEPFWFNVYVGFAYMLMCAAAAGYIFGVVAALNWAGRRFGERGFMAVIFAVFLLTTWIIGTLVSYLN